MFLMGPFKQISRMFDERRRVSTCIYLTALVLTVVAALVFHSVRPHAGCAGDPGNSSAQPRLLAGPGSRCWPWWTASLSCCARCHFELA